MHARLGAAALLALTLSACETATVYQPAARPGAVGYNDYRIEPGRYRINFQGGDSAPPTQVHDYVLLRAAQVTLRDGYDWFQVVGGEGYLAPPTHRASLSFGIGGFNFGRGGGFGGGVATSVPVDPGPRIGRSIEILAGHGAPPDVHAYDARSIVANLGPRATPRRE